ncbi:MAG: class I SAM-dependent rRNA methyltransferase [Bacteroidota bacterium]
MASIILKPKKDAPVRRFHPWIFSGAIQKIKGDPADGDMVEVFSHDDEFLATGHFQQGASIAVRIFAFEKISDPGAFWLKKIAAAKSYRQALGLPNPTETNCYRLIHAEGDGLPSLIIDVYGKTAVMQCHSIGMHRDKTLIVNALVEVFGENLEAVFDKSKETLPGKYAATIQNGCLFGTSSPQVVHENGHAFFVDWEAGQKTGFFLDQRDNRQLLTKYVSGKSVLNGFCYSGGFSIYALNAGARLVHSVDASQKAIDWTERNVKLAVEKRQLVVASGQLEGDHEVSSELGEHESFAADVLKFLKECPAYEVMVIDPPAFAKSLEKRHNAVQGYKRLNIAALQKVAPGGVLFTFSCSQVIDRELFYNTVVAAAIEAGRQVKVMHHLSQPADHPVSLFHPEGAYLKGLCLFVE